MSTLSAEDRFFLEGAVVESPKCSSINGWDWWSWPQAFSDTTGPRGGAGGQAFTQFQVFGFENQQTGKRFKYCAGVWRPWDGEIGGNW